MLMARTDYPREPLPPMATVLLEAFLAEREVANSDTVVDPVAEQRAYALYVGACDRAQQVRANSHGGQAAALLVNIDEVDRLLDGHYSISGEPNLDHEELGVLHKIRQSMENLLTWHFEQGAGALRPIAEHQGILHGHAAQGTR